MKINLINKSDTVKVGGNPIAPQSESKGKRGAMVGFPPL
jgi:hypothetical protein